MRTSPAGRALIEQFEGLRLQAYRDAVGIWTIGCGHTARAGAPIPHFGLTLTRQQCDSLLEQDLKLFEDGVQASVHVPLEQHQFDALVSLAFNIGVANFRSSTLLRLLNQRQYAPAAEHFLDWVRAGGKKLAGLVRRRQAERAMFLQAERDPILPMARRVDAEPQV